MPKHLGPRDNQCRWREDDAEHGLRQIVTSWQARKLILNDFKLGFDCREIGARLIGLSFIRACQYEWLFWDAPTSAAPGRNSVEGARATRHHYYLGRFDMQRIRYRMLYPTRDFSRGRDAAANARSALLFSH